MVYSVPFWHELYQRLKFEALCIDIETTKMDGPISLVGVYKLKNGEIDYTAFIRGKNLTTENLAAAFRDCKLILTYNGYDFDVPKIRKEFPGALPDSIPVFDVYLFAKAVGITTNLKVLEMTFSIDRLDHSTQQRGIALKLWYRYERYGDESALAQLIEYNKQDAINLYPLAEELVKIAEKKGFVDL